MGNYGTPFINSDNLNVEGFVNKANGRQVVDATLINVNGEGLSVDSASRALVGITNAHHNIHAGKSYTTEVGAAGGIGTKATITFTTPNTTKWLHMLVHAISNVEANYTLGESPTITPGTGTNFPVYNRNRNSLNTSDVIATQSAVAGQMTAGATVTDFGTILKDIHFGKGKVGGESREDDEWVLKQNTTYVLEVISEAASSDNMIELDWYEHISGT